MKYSLLTPLLFVVIVGFSQDISRQEADSMKIALKNMLGYDRADLLLHLAQYHILKEGESPVDFDSAAVCIREAEALIGLDKSSATYGFLRLTESYLAREKGEMEKGKRLAEEAVAVLESSANKLYLGRAYYELSMHYDFRNEAEVKTRIELVQRAIDAFQKAGDLQAKARSLEMLGDLYVSTDRDVVRGISILKEALATYDSIKYPHLQGVYVLLGDSYMTKEDYGEALFYLLKALRTAQLNNISSMQLCQINHILGLLYQNIDRCDIGIKYFSDGLEIARKHNDRDAICILAFQLAIAYCELHRPVQALEVLKSIPTPDRPSHKVWVSMTYINAHTQLQQFEKAQPHCDTILRMADRKLVDDYLRVYIYRAVATYFFSMKHYQKTRYYLLKCIEIGRPGFGNESAEVFRLLYKLDSVQGNFRSAFKNLYAYKTTMDSVTNQKKVLQFQVLAVEYEVGMKEDSIKLKDEEISFLTQRNTLQHANLKQASLIKNITVAGIVLAFIVIGLLFRQYKQKQKSNNLITQKNGQLQHFLTEKEWLLKEIHHRVKNNLQMVMSLLNSQSAYIDNQPALSAIHDSQHRVHAMSLIHQKLYSADNVSSIEVSAYIHELVTYLTDSFDTGRRIRFEFAVEPLEMDVSQAVPLGLILNEAITNAIKYAFPGDRSGVISISLSSTCPNNYLLIISDNGVGISPHSTSKKRGSLGMSLMEGLSEDLDGHFSIENKNGVTIKISFLHELGAMRDKTLSTSSVL